MPGTEKAIETNAVTEWSSVSVAGIHAFSPIGSDDGDEYDTPEFRAALVAHFHQARAAAILEHAEQPR